MMNAGSSWSALRFSFIRTYLSPSIPLSVHGEGEVRAGSVNHDVRLALRAAPQERHVDALTLRHRLDALLQGFDRRNRRVADADYDIEGAQAGALRRRAG